MGSKRRHIPSLLRYGALPLGVVLLVLLLRAFLFMPLTLQTSALSPSYPRGAWVLVLKSFEPEHGDCVLIDLGRLGLAKPSEPSLVAGRVVGLPGDSLELRQGLLYVNGRRAQDHRRALNVREHYALRLPRAQGVYPLSPVSLVAYRQALLEEQRAEERLHPGRGQLGLDSARWMQRLSERALYTFAQDYYWVLADDTSSGPDSRHLGIIPREAIVGRLLFGLGMRSPFVYP